MENKLKQLLIQHGIEQFSANVRVSNARLNLEKGQPIQEVFNELTYGLLLMNKAEVIQLLDYFHKFKQLVTN